MIDERLVQQVTEELYSAALRRVPDDTKAALARARDSEDNTMARATLDLMFKSALAAETNDKFVCSDSGVPVYLVEIGGRAQWRGDAHGHSIYERLSGDALARRAAILARLDERRAAAGSAVGATS